MRIVVLDNEKKVEKDFVAELGCIDINIIDRPSFCIYTRCNPGGFDELIFRFSILDEEKVSASSLNEVIFVNYGMISGCLYRLLLKSNDYNFKEIQSLYKIVKEKNKNVRFQHNIKSFFILAKAVITEVNKPENK